MLIPAPSSDDRPAAAAPRDAAGLEEAFTELSDLVVSSTPLREVLSRVVELARDRVVPAGHLSMTLVREGVRPRTAASTHLAATVQPISSFS